LPNAVAALRTELGLEEETFDAVTVKKYETLLEKKWTSVIRLQKKASPSLWLPLYLPLSVSCLLFHYYYTI
jgi:platelet-activating factor acetylhydrolase IB subunit alpha